MKDFDPISHLDFPVPAKLEADFGVAGFESFEERRLAIVRALFQCVSSLDTLHGIIHPSDTEAYVDRLNQLEIMMRDHMSNFGLSHGDVVQANVPSMIYPAGFKAEFSAGESVRAKVEGLAIYPHYCITPDGEEREGLPFGINISVFEPTIVTPYGEDEIDIVSDVNPLISLHHHNIDLHRIILPD